ncbi:helix-turn-helix domain-containing protein [Pandoraea sp. XY-2]|uniref:helix-turn-helix domain-containing protein n=1 Tax=Pandoraea sp. XY-2 TaxID=2518599 RepID=UPI00101B1E62|nr:helix-turn-helix domain-containing protein [Pandoraea sp. XY-2]QBC30814.1 helix-turn-helix domain-containing protein [Pandoraea sp. XY-2]
MDSLIAASARALAAGDSLGALRRIALRDDAPALALRGIAMAQLGEFARARELFKRAARSFGPHEALARARCVVADAEVALAMRDLGGSTRSLHAAAAVLLAHADIPNAMLAHLVLARRLVLLGKLDAAAQALQDTPSDAVPARLVAGHALICAELALRTLRIPQAHAMLAHAQTAASAANIPALIAEVESVHAALARPAARLAQSDGERALNLDEVARLLHSDVLVVDACRRGISAGSSWRPLARRPALFTLALQLARAWPGDVDRDTLIGEVFRLRRPDDTHRARLRVEIGRLRALLKGLADIDATPRGFVLRTQGERAVSVLLPPIDGNRASLVALLSDGAAWSTSALALALGASQRTVQRALSALEHEGRVCGLGRARARRWTSPPLTEFTTTLLLPVGWSFG